MQGSLCVSHCSYFLSLKFQVLDNTINKVAEEVLSAEELEERQLKIQASIMYITSLTVLD